MNDKYFYETNKKILELIENNAPTDDQLISVPKTLSAVDPFQLSIIKVNPDMAYRGFILLPFLQSINTTLARVFASHTYLIQHKDDASSAGLNQFQIDSIMLYQNLIILEHRSSLIIFFLKLRLATDEIIRLFTENICDCIGTYFKKRKNDNNSWKFFHHHEPFLASLNAAANFVKHNEYLLDNLRMLGDTPCLYIQIKNKYAEKFDYENIEKYFAGQFQEVNASELLFPVSCDYIIKEFNKLKTTLEKLSSQD